MSIGPFKSGDTVRIPLSVTMGGETIPVSNPRVQRLIDPDQNDASGFPQNMTELETGVYFLEIDLYTIGNYMAILRAELDTGQTIETIEPFVVESAGGTPRIELA